MKISQISAYRNNRLNFKANADNQNTEKNHRLKINKTDAQLFFLISAMTAFKGVDIAKKNFSNATTAGKIGKILGGIGITFALSVPMTLALKFFSRFNPDK